MTLKKAHKSCRRYRIAGSRSENYRYNMGDIIQECEVESKQKVYEIECMWQ